MRRRQLPAVLATLAAPAPIITITATHDSTRFVTREHMLQIR